MQQQPNMQPHMQGNMMPNAQAGSQGQGQNAPNAPFGAHEIIGMNEVLQATSANAEVLNFLAHHAQDPQVRQLLERQAQAMEQHYVEGVRVLQTNSPMGGQGYQTSMHTQPKLGLRHPTYPAPNLQAQAPSDRAICAVALNLHKFGAMMCTMFALECASPQFRTFLMTSASLCDRMAYDLFAYMNQKGDYQVATLQKNTTQTMIDSYQMPGQMAQPGMPQAPNVQ
ncbi:spore coat protein [Alicyclobacillus mali (ex Roth et al. 2021)]|uniref:spore coat protein n=1 Tax=Alicyclobacillus mali (ex Roth et al. 2021) TaxID=1123961 RepID=UPI000831BC7B|nr:spore coat protein [Alicyclobacillus mali (ex Roth et al. 2021)]